MRIAFVDLLFAWPPPGGAQADLYYTINGLQNQGHDVHLFAPSYPDTWRHGGFDPGALPFPSTSPSIPWDAVTPNRLAKTLRTQVDAWAPDVVFLGFARYFKPYIIEALAHYPLISRYYMYEHICIRDFYLYREWQTCPNDFPRTPNVCRSCAMECWGGEIVRTGPQTPYIAELLRAGALSPGYHRLFMGALRKCDAVIVNNPMAVARIEDYCPYACVVPGGVMMEDYAGWLPLEERPDRERTVILMTGRTDRPLKGMDVLVWAGKALSRFRSDFEIWVTGDEDPVGEPWFKACGWRNHSEVVELYREADLVVAPSIWQEPYGLVAVEGMAAGRPVLASRVGGLQTIVRHGETGCLFEAEASAELALYLERLLDDPAERQRMGRRGREIAEAEYDWQQIIDDHYPPLLERVAADGAARIAGP